MHIPNMLIKLILAITTRILTAFNHALKILRNSMFLSVALHVRGAGEVTATGSAEGTTLGNFVGTCSGWVGAVLWV